MGAYENIGVRGGRASGTLVHRLMLAHALRNPEIPEVCISEESLENHRRRVSWILQSPCNWEELDYRLGNAHTG